MKFYITDSNPNGTCDLIIVDGWDQVVGSVDEALFGRVPPKDFGWSGDSLGNISAMFYGESVGMIGYDEEHEVYGDDGQTVIETRSLVDEVQEHGFLGDVVQVIEVDYDTVREYLAVSPCMTALENIKRIHAVMRRCKR